jgi:hypothetical protein
VKVVWSVVAEQRVIEAFEAITVRHSRRAWDPSEVVRDG